MGIDQDVQKQLGVPLANILRAYNPQQHDYPNLSILHIFNASLFCKAILTLLPDIISIPYSLKKNEHLNYDKAWAILKQAGSQLGLDLKNYEEPASNFLSREKIQYEQEMISNSVWHCLRILCDLLFQIMLKNQSVLYTITQMDQKYQVAIKQYIQSHQEFNSIKVQLDSPNMNKNQSKTSLTHSHGDQNVYDKIEELEHTIQAKDQELARLKQICAEKKDQLLLLKGVLSQKQTEINGYKRRIAAYSQTDLLFQEKDEEIAKLVSQLTDLKMKSHVKTTELNNQITKLKQAVKDIQQEKSELVITNEQLINKNQLLTVSKQEGDSANKKVITNLKQKIKNLNERIAQQQKSMMDVLMQKQQRQKQIFEMEKKVGGFESGRKSKLMTKNEDLNKSARRSSKLMDELGDLTDLGGRESNELRQYYEVLFGELDDRCTGHLCIALRSEYVRVVKKLLQINHDTQSLTYMTPQNRLECVLNQLNRISEACQQNLKLKEKIVLMQSQGGKGQISKQSIQQINKLKKKLLVMKRTLQEVQTKRKQELDILVSAYHQNFSFHIKS